MFTIKRFSEQFKILLLQNIYRHGLYLLCISLYLIYKHYQFFYNGGGADLMDSAEFVMVLASVISSIDVFGKLRRTDSGIHYMMSPANIIDKYAAAWVYSTIFTFSVYLLTYNLIHFISFSLGNLIMGLEIPYQFRTLNQIRENFTVVMFFQSLYFLGSILFRKNPFVKTTASIIGIVITISIVGGYIVNQYYLRTVIPEDTRININIGQEMSLNGVPFLELMKDYGVVIKTMVYSIPFICWILTYFKLKKIEI